MLSLGQELLRKMSDPEADPGELLSEVRSAVARQEFVGMLKVRDERGRSPLHVATSHGDLRMCQEILSADPGIVNEVDSRRNTPVMDAALYGRSLILKELIDSAADVTRKNLDCMSALQLACVNEGAGSGDVVEQLIQAAADPSQMCWQTTPLMAAADSGHIWAVQVLIELGTDVWQANSSGMSALDFARDMETAQFLYDVMQGDRLSNKPAPGTKPFKNAEARRARLHKAAKDVALEDAFATLEVPAEWLPAFRSSGEHFNEIRKAWRKICLCCHPDKQPDNLENEEVAEWTAKFQMACAAFEAVEIHFRSVCAEEGFQDDQIASSKNKNQS